LTYQVTVNLSGLVVTSGTNPSATLQPSIIPGVGTQPAFFDMSQFDYANFDVTTALSANTVTEKVAVAFVLSGGLALPYRVASFYVGS
jgi:hypothetical protein